MILKIQNFINAKFIDKDFRKILDGSFGKSDFVYLDPPYLLGLASYNEGGGWSIDDERDLYNALHGLNAKNVKFALSNVTEHKGQSNELLLKFIKDNQFKCIQMDYNYKNANYQSKAKNSVTKEVLVTNY